jgi:hypothetical protein
MANKAQFADIPRSVATMQLAGNATYPLEVALIISSVLIIAIN